MASHTFFEVNISADKALKLLGNQIHPNPDEDFEITGTGTTLDLKYADTINQVDGPPRYSSLQQIIVPRYGFRISPVNPINLECSIATTNPEVLLKKARSLVVSMSAELRLTHEPFNQPAHIDEVAQVEAAHPGLFMVHSGILKLVNVTNLDMLGKIEAGELGSSLISNENAQIKASFQIF